jgi:hypothetical protein
VQAAEVVQLRSTNVSPRVNGTFLLNCDLTEQFLFFKIVLSAPGTTARIFNTPRGGCGDLPGYYVIVLLVNNIVCAAGRGPRRFMRPSK